MALNTKQEQIQQLEAIDNPRHISYKFLGVLAWAGLIFAFVGAFFVPRIVLEFARLIALYTLIRLGFVVYFYLIGLLRLKQRQRHVRLDLARRTNEGLASDDHIHHVVVIPNYKEPEKILVRTLGALAKQVRAERRLTVVLAMEEGETTAAEKGARLGKLFAGQFANFMVTIHPANIPGEAAGKASNEAYAARQARHRLVDEQGMKLENLTITSCDADTVIHPHYFYELTRQFLKDPTRYTRIWQAPMFFYNNIWEVPAAIRLLTFFQDAVQLSELVNPLNLAMPVSTYSLSYVLLEQAGYWDLKVIAEDWHMFLRCFFATRGKVTLKPIMLPASGDAIGGRNLLDGLGNYYVQQLRHAWGGQDVGYLLQQWFKPTGTPWMRTFARFTKILHDYLIFSSGALVIVLGTALSIRLDNNALITMPNTLLYPEVLQVVNIVGGVSFWVLWLVERARSSGRSWHLKAFVTELLTWIIFPLVTIAVTVIPVMHAMTKMLLGANLKYVRAPKGTTRGQK